MRNSANPSPGQQLQLHSKQQQQQQQQESLTLIPQHHAWPQEDCVATVAQPGAAARATRAPAEATPASQLQQQQDQQLNCSVLQTNIKMLAMNNQSLVSSTKNTSNQV